MRTTFDIEDRLLEEIRLRAELRGVSMRELVNELIRLGLQSELVDVTAEDRFVVEPFLGGFVPGIDPSRFNGLWRNAQREGSTAGVVSRLASTATSA